MQMNIPWKWEVVKNGTSVENGTMDVDIPAGEKQRCWDPVPTTPTDAAAGDEYFLKYFIRNKE